MDKLFIIISAVLLLCAIYLLVRFLRLKKQLRSFSKTIKNRTDNDSREPLKVGDFDKDIMELAVEINRQFDKQNKQLNEASHDKEKMQCIVSGISHDFRTPLTSSLGYLQMLEKSGEIRSELGREHLRIATEKNRYLKKLSDDFFDVSKLSFSKNRERLIEELDLSSMVEESLLHYYDRINERGLKTEFNIEPGVILNSERLDVERIIENIFSNASKYSATFIKVSLKGKTLKVSNDCIDRNDFDQTRVFEPFYRGNSRSETGSGLGLFLVKSLADDLDFEVGVKCVENVYEIFVKFDR